MSIVGSTDWTWHLALDLEFGAKVSFRLQRMLKQRWQSLNSCQLLYISRTPPSLPLPTHRATQIAFLARQVSFKVSDTCGGAAVEAGGVHVVVNRAALDFDITPIGARRPTGVCSFQERTSAQIS